MTSHFFWLNYPFNTECKQCQSQTVHSATNYPNQPVKITANYVTYEKIVTVNLSPNCLRYAVSLPLCLSLSLFWWTDNEEGSPYTLQLFLWSCLRLITLIMAKHMQLLLLIQIEKFHHPNRSNTKLILHSLAMCIDGFEYSAVILALFSRTRFSESVHLEYNLNEIIQTNSVIQ